MTFGARPVVFQLVLRVLEISFTENKDTEGEMRKSKIWCCPYEKDIKELCPQE